MKEIKYQRISVRGLAFSLGIVWGLAVLLAGWFSITGWASQFVLNLSSLYVGYTSSFWGGIVGAVWGFIDGFLGGFFLAFFYNLFVTHGLKK